MVIEMADTDGTTCSPGAALITRERERQLDEEGWTDEHDDEHANGELAWAAVCYAAPTRIKASHIPESLDGGDPWPWSEEWDKRPGAAASRVERIRALEKAGALLAAEIDRLLRLQCV